MGDVGDVEVGDAAGDAVGDAVAGDVEDDGVAGGDDTLRLHIRTFLCHVFHNTYMKPLSWL